MEAVDLRPAHGALRDMNEALGSLTSAAEGEFLKIGSALSRAVRAFGRLGADFAALAGHLRGRDAGSATASLERAGAAIGRTGGDDGTDGLLTQLDAGAADMAVRLDRLRRIVGEIRALAVNAKIQASLVTAGDVDFSVFTLTIAQLCRIADEATERAAVRLASARRAVGSARGSIADFGRTQACELETVRLRIEASLATLFERRKTAAEAAALVAARSQAIAEQIAEAVGALQVNDSVCQRLEHVRAALRILTSLVTADPVTEPGAEWANDIPLTERPVLVGAASRLQADQLAGAAQDYCREVVGLGRNLSRLASDAAEILAAAEAAFGGNGGNLFVEEIERDILRAGELYAAHRVARDRTRSVVAAVSDAFDAMEADLAALRSVDTEMRITGINATLKCSRLGAEGRGLGVVAQELRACCIRTEDGSRGIAEQMKKSRALSEQLKALGAVDESTVADEPVGVIAESAAALSTLTHAMAVALEGLREQAGVVSAELSQTVSAIEIHHRVGADSRDAAARLVAIADGVGAKIVVGEALRETLHRLMRHRYTMDRERLIHHAFTGDAIIPSETATDTAGDADDCFL